MHTESWLYKNYNKPLTESDTNGIVVAFDPTRKNALLHQQVKALQERTRFDRRVIAKTDSATALLSIAEDAWQEGYEHLTVLTSDDRLSEVDRFLQTRCGDAFKTITVVPESTPRAFMSPRLYEVDMGALGAAASQTEEEQTEAQPAKQSKAGTPISLFLLQTNPPVTGTSKLIEMGQQTLSQMKAPEATYAFHNTNIARGYAFTAKFRSFLVRGDDRKDAPSLYGKNGEKAVNDIMKMNSRNHIDLAYMSLADAMINHPQLKGREIAAVVVPEGVQMDFGTIDQSRIKYIKPSVDAFTPSHKQLIDLGRKIAADCPVEKNENNEDNVELKKDEITDLDAIALHIINACHYSIELEGEAFDKKMDITWGAIDAGTKEFAKELGELSGIGTMASGIKDIVDTVGKVTKADEPDKAHQLQSLFNGLEGLDIDVVKAVNHSDYAKLYKALDLD